jgi:hypothetical protein
MTRSRAFHADSFKEKESVYSRHQCKNFPVREQELLLVPPNHAMNSTTRAGDIETKTHSVYCSTFLLQIKLHRLFLFRQN